MAKRMRLPNGFGQISYLRSQRLRKPYRAMVTVGKTPEGRPICKILKPEGYFQTYNEAYAALMEYNKCPYDLTNSVTFKEVYEKWFEKYQLNKSLSAVRAVEREFDLCGEIWDLDLREVRPYHIKSCMDKTDSPKYKKGIRYLFQEVLSLGMECGAVEVNVARDYSPKISNEGKKKVSDHTVFTEEELEKLWNDRSDPISKAILIQCYTGFRPKELCSLRKENIKNEYFIGGMKTVAGKDRVVPIIEKIKGLVEEAADHDGE